MMDANEKCHYCEKEGQYTQLVGEEPDFFMSLVCKKHFVMDTSE